MEQLADGRYGPWRWIDRTFGTKIDGGNPNSDANVLHVHERTPGQALAPQFAMVRMTNKGSAASVGFGVRFMKAMWVAGQWVNGTTTYTDDTTDFQSAATGDCVLETTTNNDGHIVACKKLFSAICYNVSTASTGSPVRTLEYSTGTSTWTAMPAFHSFIPSGANYALGENFAWFAIPNDWAVMAAGHGTGVPVGYYGIRVRSTTAPTVAAIASSITVHYITPLAFALATSATATMEFGGQYAPFPPDCDAIVGCSQPTNGGNSIQALIRTRE